MTDRALLIKLIYPLAVLFFIFRILPADAAETDAWRFALGYSYLNNVAAVKSSYKHLSRDDGDGNDIYNTTVSLSFQPYYQLRNGFRAGAGIGPLVLLIGDAYHIEIPVNITLGYSFMIDSDISPYIRTGIAYHIASGDFYSDASPGFFGAVGCKIFNTRPVCLGVEAACDTSEITLEGASGHSDHEKIKTGLLTFYLYADF